MLQSLNNPEPYTVKGKRGSIQGTHQQLSFFIADKSDCFERAITISSVNRAMVASRKNTR